MDFMAILSQDFVSYLRTVPPTTMLILSHSYALTFAVGCFILEIIRQKNVI
jgi:hypothetical protein